MSDWTLDGIYDCIVDDGETEVYRELNIEDYDLREEGVAYDIESDIDRLVRRFFDNGGIDGTLDSALIYTQDCENLLGELGIGFKEMMYYHDNLGCDSVESCASVAVTEWCYGKQSDMEFDIAERVKDKISEEYDIDF